jgi:hypothetical protein
MDLLNFSCDSYFMGMIQKFYLPQMGLVLKLYAGPERICSLILGMADSGNHHELKRIERYVN